MRRTWAPWLRRYLATASSSGPLPATTTFLPGHGQTGFGEGLQSAGAHDVGQRPAGKRQKAFARTGGQDQVAVAELEIAIDTFRGRGRPGAGAAKTRTPQIGSVRCWRWSTRHWARPRQICPPGLGLSSTSATRAPDSTARWRPRGRPVRRRRPRRRRSASGIGARPPCPERRESGNSGSAPARRCVTRHSKQMPIPHSGPRGSPVTDLRNPLHAGKRDRGRHHRTRRHGHRRAVDRERDGVSHEAPPDRERPGRAARPFEYRALRHGRRKRRPRTRGSAPHQAGSEPVPAEQPANQPCDSSCFRPGR